MMHPLLADLTLSNEAIAFSVIGIIVMLLGAYASARSFIRTSAGVRETQRVEIDGQPVRFDAERRHVEQHVHDEFKSSIERQLSEMWEVINGLRLAISGMASDMSGIRATTQAKGERIVEMSAELKQVAQAVNHMSGVIEGKLKTNR